MSTSPGGFFHRKKETSRLDERLINDGLASSSRITGYPAGIGTSFLRLPRYQRAGPSTSLDEKM